MNMMIRRKVTKIDDKEGDDEEEDGGDDGDADQLLWGPLLVKDEGDGADDEAM